jgi:hypothetical protein
LKKSIRGLCLAAVAAIGLSTAIARADDSVVTPFLDNQSNAVVYADLSKVDMDQIESWRQKAIAAANLDPAEKQKQDAESKKNLDKAKQWIGDFTTAGGKDLYVDVTLGGLLQGAPGAIIVPIAAGANSDALAKVFNPAGNAPAGDPNGMQSAMRAQTEVVGNTLVYTTGSQVQKFKTPSAEARPDLADGLAAGGAAPIRLVIVPSTIKKLPIFMIMMAQRNAQGAAAQQNIPFMQPEWDNVTWMSATFIPPPNESGSVVIQCKDADSANAMATMINTQFDQQKNDPKARAQYGDALDKLAVAAKPAVDGSKVTITLTQDTLDNVVGPMMTKAMQSTPKRDAAGGPPGEPGIPPQDSGGGM